MRKLKRLSLATFCVAVALFSSFTVFGQPVADSEEELIHWMDIEEVIEISGDKSDKKILLQIYTNWCGWCREMERITYAEPHIAQYINENFYPVKFNAETKKTIEYNGKAYEFIMRPGLGGYHELAAELLNGRFSFPTVVFLEEDMKFIQAIVGFKSPKEFERIITYFATDKYKNTPWATYKKSYKSLLMTARE